MSKLTINRIGVHKEVSVAIDQPIVGIGDSTDVMDKPSPQIVCKTILTEF